MTMHPDIPPPPDPTAPVLDWARWYVARGLSVIPVRADGSKAMALTQGQVFQYRESFADDATLAGWFAPHRAVGIAVLCGKVSGNLAAFDFESDAAWQRWRERVTGTPVEAAAATAPLVRTPKGGRHLYLRIAETFRNNTVYARRADKTTLIEMRGEGGYVVAPGSPLACHPLNAPYVWERMGWLARV